MDSRSDAGLAFIASSMFLIASLTALAGEFLLMLRGINGSFPPIPT
jgi:hypothetical protein